MGTLRVSALRGGRVDNEEGFTFDDDAEPVVWAGLQGSVNASAACDDEDVNLDFDFDRVGTVAKRAVLSAALATSLTSDRTKRRKTRPANVAGACSNCSRCWQSRC